MISVKIFPYKIQIIKIFKLLRRWGPGIWSLSLLDAMYNRKTKLEEEKESWSKKGWSHGGESQGDNLHSKLISVKSNRTLLRQTKQVNIYLMKANKLILSYPLHCFARPLVVADFVNLCWRCRKRIKWGSPHNTLNISFSEIPSKFLSLIFSLKIFSSEDLCLHQNDLSPQWMCASSFKLFR